MGRGCSGARPRQDLVSGNPLSRNPLRRRLRWGAEQRSLLCRVALALELEGGDGVVLTLGCRGESGLAYSGEDVAVLLPVDAARAAGVELTKLARVSLRLGVGSGLRLALRPTIPA